jgi:hypothetical protein
MTDPDRTEPTSPPDPARADTGQFVVAPTQPETPRRPTAWSVLGAVASLGVVLLAAWGLLTQSSPQSPVARPAPTAPTLVPSAGASPTPGLRIVDVGSGDEAIDELATLAGWGGCPVWRAFDVAATVAPRAVDRAVQAAGVDHGPIDVEDATGTEQHIWVGGDVIDAARGFGGSFVVREVEAAWTVIPVDGGDMAVRLKPTARRDGGTFWQVSARAAPAPYCSDRSIEPGTPVRILPASGDPQAALFEAAGLDRCPAWTRSASGPVPSVDAIEAAAADELIPPGSQGWIEIPASAVGGTRPMRAWVGADERAAAAAHGSTLMAIGEDGAEAWLLVTLDDLPGAIELRRVHTPRAWTAWLPTPNAAGLTRSDEGRRLGCVP